MSDKPTWVGLFGSAPDFGKHFRAYIDDRGNDGCNCGNPDCLQLRYDELVTDHEKCEWAWDRLGLLREIGERWMTEHRDNARQFGKELIAAIQADRIIGRCEETGESIIGGCWYCFGSGRVEPFPSECPECGGCGHLHDWAARGDGEQA